MAPHTIPSDRSSLVPHHPLNAITELSHSKFKAIRKRKSWTKFQRLKSALNKRFEEIQKTAERLNPRVVVIKDASLGDLRASYSTRHVSIQNDPVRMDVGAFTRYPPHGKRPLKVTAGRDGGFLLYRLPVDNTEDVRLLHRTISQLPPVSQSASKGFQRSKYVARSYGVNCFSSRRPFFTSDYIRDGRAAEQWIEENEPIWKRIEFAIGIVSKRVFQQYQLFPSDVGEDGQGRLFGVFTRCFINQGAVDIDASNPHRDPAEPRDGLVAVISTGDYSGGGLALHDLKIVVETNPGDIIVFPDSVLYHSNEAVKGARNSVVCVTPNNMLAYWGREYNMKRRMNWKDPSKKQARLKSIKTNSQGNNK